MSTTLEKTLAAELSELRQTGQYKQAVELGAPQAPHTTMSGRTVINLSSNNYLGLCNHPRVVAAARLALDEFGLGTASVRFICGTMSCHLALEERICEFLGCEAATTFISCWDANVGLIPTLAPTKADAIFSDALNHASIIDAIRLSKAQRFIFKHADLDELERMLQTPEARAARNKLIVTDGVFSMEGDVANLPRLKQLADQYDAALIVDESHATGVLGQTGKGTAEHFGVLGAGTIQTSTLGKALGGACGGYVAASKTVCDYLVQKSRPQLFSNALPPAVCYGSMAAIDVLMGKSDGATLRRDSGQAPRRSDGGGAAGRAEDTEARAHEGGSQSSALRGGADVASACGAMLLERLRSNTRHFREGVGALGLKSIDGITPIVPLIVGETPTAIAMQKALLEEGVFVSGFGFPVVPKGEARLRCQISAGHTKDDLDECLAALKKVAERFPESRAS